MNRKIGAAEEARYILGVFHSNVERIQERQLPLINDPELTRRVEQLDKMLLETYGYINSKLEDR